MTSPNDPHKQQPDAAPAAPVAEKKGEKKPRRTRRNLIIGAAALVVVALLVWDLSARLSGKGGPGTVDNSATQQPSAQATGQPSKKPAPVSQKDRDVAVRYEKLSSAKTVHGATFCPLVVDESGCKKEAAADLLGGGGLSGPVTVHSAVLLPAADDPGAAPSDSIGGAGAKLPETAVVLLDLHGTSSNQPHQSVILVRTSDHRVMAEELILKAQERYTLPQLGERIRSGAEDGDIVDWTNVS